MTIPQAFDRLAERHPAKTAVVYLGTRYSYGRLRRWSEAFAAGLQRLGVRAGDRVLLDLPNSPQWIVAWLGTLKAGAIAVPITPIYAAPEVRRIAVHAGARAVVCTDVNVGYVQEAVADTAVDAVVVTAFGDLLPLWKRVVGRALDRVPRGRIPRGGRVQRLRTLLAADDGGLVPPASAADVAEILYTGGTTRGPKGVPITHGLFLGCAEEQVRISAPLVAPEDNVVLSGAPLFHVLGQTCGLAVCCVTGGTLIVLPRLNLDGLLDAVERGRATTIIGVPALYRMILEHERLDRYDLRSLRYCMSGGDVLPAEIGRRWEARFGVPILEGYGATETCGGVAMTPPGGHRPGSVGRVLPSKVVRVVAPDTLEPVPAGEPGELLVSSEPMVRAYWEQPEETAAAFVDLDGRRWYRTGDVMAVDGDGFLSFVDRTADVIKHKGYRVSASEIEAVLQEHPAVVAACVVGVPDPDVGERIKAVVVLKKDVKGVTGYDLISWCRARLADYKVPQHVEFRDMLPKSKVGKLLRREIRGEERARAAIG
jgi:long-chain acyl-CoA synthetase